MPMAKVLQQKEEPFNGRGIKKIGDGIFKKSGVRVVLAFDYKSDISYLKISFW